MYGLGKFVYIAVCMVAYVTMKVSGFHRNAINIFWISEENDTFQCLIHTLSALKTRSISLDLVASIQSNIMYQRVISKLREFIILKHNHDNSTYDHRVDDHVIFTQHCYLNWIREVLNFDFLFKLFVFFNFVWNITFLRLWSF